MPLAYYSEMVLHWRASNYLCPSTSIYSRICVEAQNIVLNLPQDFYLVSYLFFVIPQVVLTYFFSNNIYFLKAMQHIIDIQHYLNIFTITFPDQYIVFHSFVLFTQVFDCLKLHFLQYYICFLFLFFFCLLFSCNSHSLREKKSDN